MAAMRLALAAFVAAWLHAAPAAAQQRPLVTEDPETIGGGRVLIEAGFSPEIAWFECLTEVKLLADLIYERGIAGMREAISNTAEFGALEGGPRIVTDATRAEMRVILAEVREGKMADKLIADARAGYPRLSASRREAAAHPIEDVGRRIRDLQRRR